MLSTLVTQGTRVDVLVFTHGEASTLGAGEDLGDRRAREARDAADRLGLDHVELADLPDGSLAEVDQGLLVEMIEQHLGSVDGLIAFERNGVTGHPDHMAATAAARQVAQDHALPLIEWGIIPPVAARLREEFDVPVEEVPDGDDVVDLTVDRSSQREALSCHASQANDNPFLLRRLELAGDVERIRVNTPT